MPARVLVADDDPEIVRLLEEVLVKRGFGVETARDGDEAYARAQERTPDVLVTDVMMPKLDGWSLVRKLRLDPRLADLPVIFLTALGTDDDRVKAFRLGADDYINKPFKFSDVVARIEKVLRSKQPAAPSAKASSGLAGDLSQVGLSTLLVLIEMERKTGLLQLSADDGRSGELAVRNGKVTDASIDGTAQGTAAAAVHVMLTWTAGTFEFVARDVADIDRIQQSTTHLLIEGARLMDEAAAPAAETQLDENAIAEWNADERTPVVVAAKLADLVRRTARASNPPYSIPPPSSSPAPPPPPPVIEKPVVAVEPSTPVPVQSVESTEPIAARRSGASTWWLVGSVAAAIVGAVTYMVEPEQAPQVVTVDGELEAAATAIAAALDRSADAAQLRAEGIAAMPLLRAGIETDAATLQDTVTNEIFLEPAAGEVIELAQVRDGSAAPVLRLPVGAGPIEINPGEDHGVVRDAAGLHVFARAPIKTQRGQLGGMLAVLASPIDLSPIGATLAGHARGVRLVGVGEPVVLMPASGSGPTSQVKLPIATRRPHGLALEASLGEPTAPRHPGWIVPLRYAGFMLAGVMLAGYLVQALRSR